MMSYKFNKILTKISKFMFDGRMFLKYDSRRTRYIIILSFLGTILSIIAVANLTYSFYTAIDETGNNSISTGTITMRYIEDTNFAMINNAEPISAGEAYQSTDYFSFQVFLETVDKVDMPYEITITAQSGYTTADKIRLGLKKDNLIVTDAGFNSIDYTNGVIASTLPYSNSGLPNNSQTVYKGLLSLSSAGTLTHNFKLYLWVDSEATLETSVESYSIVINVNTL